MATGYTRQSAGSITTGAVIMASHFNAEFNAIQAAFSASTGHTHDGTTGGGTALGTAALGALTTTSSGLIVANGADDFVVRTLTGTANEITVTNGTGVSGNPTLSIPSAVTFTGKTVTGGTFTTPTVNVNDDSLSIRDNADTTKILQFQCSGITTGTTRTLTVPDASGTIALTASTQPLDATLTALAAYNTNGLLTQTAADTFAGRTITGTAGTITVTNGDGVSGNPTLTIDAGYVGQASITTLGTIATGVWNGTAIGDSYISSAATWNAKQAGDATLTALAAYNTNGLLTQTAADTFAGRTLTGTANEITVTNGDGVSGNPTLSLPSALTFTGKTVTGGTFNVATGSITAPTYSFAGDTNTGIYSPSADTVSITCGGVRVLEAGTIASGVNYISVVPGATTQQTYFQATGSDSNIHIGLASKGTGSVIFTTGGNPQFAVINTASAVNYARLTGSATGNNVTLDVTGSDTNIGLQIGLAGTGKLVCGAVYSNTTATAANVTVEASGNILRSTSSRKYKNNIRDYPKSIEALKTLRPVLFKSNTDASNRDFVGLIAEEVHEAGLSELVEYNLNKEPDAVFYANTVALLINCIKDLNTRLEKLEAV